MKKALLPLLLLLTLSARAAEGDLRHGVMHVYPDSPAAETPPPAGFKPFYLSHFGRHGSRYLSREKEILPALNPLSAAEKEGILTAEGELLLQKVRELYTATNGLWGQLSTLGAEEHKTIARRMVKRYPALFRDSVRVMSSVYPRCIVSMAASTGEIARLSPRAKWSYSVGKRYQTIINTAHRTEDWIPGASLQRDYLNARLDMDEVFSRIFSNPARGKQLAGKPAALLVAAFLAWVDREAIGLEPFELDAIFGKAVVDVISESDNLARYRNMAFPNTDSLVTDIVLKAERAMERKTPSADLRYGHDNGLMRLLIQIGMEGYPMGLDEKAATAFCFAEKVPLAANLQIVFYRNKKGKVLVKFLMNEKECRLQALPGGPYYAWEDVRAALDKHLLK